MDTRPLAVHVLGVVDYEQGLVLQGSAAVLRAAHQGQDTLFLLEHPHTYTLGRRSDPAHVLYSPEEMQAKGISLFKVDRGGDVTYHGYGQLVGYPILLLPNSQEGRPDVIAYIRNLEATLIDALAAFGIQGQTVEGLTGIWVSDGHEMAKIAAIGVHVNAKNITTHGFALNVAPDMAYFTGIVPCGLHDKPVTSMEHILGEAPRMEHVIAVVRKSFCRAFQFEEVG
jgi:lipoyl(octanoyl) transferase